MYICEYVYMQLYMLRYLICVYVYMCICVYVYMYICVYVYMYICIREWSREYPCTVCGVIELFVSSGVVLRELVFRCVAPLASQGARSDAEATKLVAEVCQTWPRSASERPRDGAADRQN